MSADFYAALFEGRRQPPSSTDRSEITREPNPATRETGRRAGCRAAGINRLSIGVQSFNARQLQALGRIHGPEEALRAAADARDAGFDNFNLDLMHALPGQTPAQALDDLRQAVALEPTHRSWYELTTEPNTAFFRRAPAATPRRQPRRPRKSRGGDCPPRRASNATKCRRSRGPGGAAGTT